MSPFAGVGQLNLVTGPRYESRAKVTWQVWALLSRWAIAKIASRAPGSTSTATVKPRPTRSCGGIPVRCADQQRQPGHGAACSCRAVLQTDAAPAPHPRLRETGRGQWARVRGRRQTSSTRRAINDCPVVIDYRRYGVADGGRGHQPPQTAPVRRHLTAWLEPKYHGRCRCWPKTFGKVAVLRRGFNIDRWRRVPLRKGQVIPAELRSEQIPLCSTS